MTIILFKELIPNIVLLGQYVYVYMYVGGEILRLLFFYSLIQEEREREKKKNIKEEGL